MCRVSVVLPTYNRAHCLERSVASVLAQDYADWELILVDDGSTDGTAAVRARLSRQLGSRYRELVLPNAGVSAARNRGIALASGEFVAYLDSDDVWLPEKLGMQIVELETNSSAAFCYTDFFTFDDALRIQNSHHCSHQRFAGGIYPELLTIARNIITCPSVVVRRKALERSGLFDETMRICEDIDLWARLARDAQVAVVNLPLVGVHVRDARSFDYACSLRGRYDLHTRVLARDPGLSRDLRIGWYNEIFSTYICVAELRRERVIARTLRAVKADAMKGKRGDTADELLSAILACAELLTHTKGNCSPPATA